MNDSKSVKNLIGENDLVLVYLNEKRQFLVQITPHLKLSSDFGELILGDVIGKPYGYIGKTHLGREFYCLKPSTADLMMKVKRTTTIVYPKDTGYLLLETAIGPGSKVIEVGTGSGALTLVLAKFVAPDGMVYTYDRREEFIENAKKNIERAGYINNVEFFCHDVAEQEFLQKGVDAIFIDVPEPWTIIPKAAKVLKGGHHMVSWSPNVEQVKSTVDALQNNGFIRIKVSEIVEREMLVRQQGVRPRERGVTHTAYLVTSQKILGSGFEI
ncbi:MAG: tRNA (adenine-N1)-methyltransferase [candidate division WOR-3 bacterium]|nr:MAG: tRNA (adenine-N1)-methyltransferase [candidate division WOR-3 bacterium]